MNIKKYVQFSFMLLIVTNLLLANTTSAVAGGGKGGGSGEVSVSITYPPEGTDAVKSLPGGGSATATASIIYNSVSVKGKATTSVSNAAAYYSICAQTTHVWKDGVWKGGSNFLCGGALGNGSISATKTVYESPYGHTWMAQTYHQVSNAGFGWYPTLNVSASL